MAEGKTITIIQKGKTPEPPKDLQWSLRLIPIGVHADLSGSGTLVVASRTTGKVAQQTVRYAGEQIINYRDWTSEDAAQGCVIEFNGSTMSGGGEHYTFNEKKTVMSIHDKEIIDLQFRPS